MKFLVTASLIVLFCSCIQKKKNIHKKREARNVGTRIYSQEFQSILDNTKLEGSILIYDFQKDSYYSNDFEWANTGKLPASTYKIPNSIIALETGIVENDRTVLKWDGEPRALSIWEQDLKFRQAFQFSCVPCYQNIARRIGSDKMNDYLARLEYGDMKVATSNIDMFWLEGDSKINQFQQINFLKRLYQKKLPISKRTDTIMRRLMVIEENETYTLSGKTGWSISKGNNNGWFVGYIEKENSVYFFSSNVEPVGEFDQDFFIRARKEVVYKALKHLEVIE